MARFSLKNLGKSALLGPIGFSNVALNEAGKALGVGDTLKGIATGAGLVEGEREKRLRQEQEEQARQGRDRADAFSARSEEFVPGRFQAPQIPGRGPQAGLGGPATHSGVSGVQGGAPRPGGELVFRGQAIGPDGQPVAPGTAAAPPGGAFGAPLGGAGQDVRAQQGALGQAIMDRALGVGGPSVAALQAEQARQANLANQIALSRANRSSTVGGASRLAALGSAAVQSQAAGQGALLRAQEQQAAQGLATQALAGQRGQDIQAALGQARIDSAEDIANLQAQLTTMGLNQQQSATLIQAALAERGISQQQIEALMAQNEARINRNRQNLGAGIKLGTDAVGAFLGKPPTG